MCVSIRAPAQDLIISSVYQRAKTLSRSTAARFEVNLHNGPMFALSRARALSVSVGTVMSWEHRGRDAHSRWLILESDAQLAPMDVRMGDSQQYEWVMEIIPVWIQKEEGHGCWMFLLQVQHAEGDRCELRPAVSDGRGQSQRAAGLENRWVGKPFLITVCFYLWIHISRCICCLFCLIRWLQSYLTLKMSLIVTALDNKLTNFLRFFRNQLLKPEIYSLLCDKSIILEKYLGTYVT